MWLAFRAIILLVAVVLRAFPRLLGVRDDAAWEGVRLLVRQRQHKKQLTGYSLGAPLEHTMRFSFSRESSTDKTVKSLGLVDEVQTGDASFDDAVYVGADHPGLRAHLQRSAPLRQQVRALLDSGVTRIHSDGAYVWIDRSTPSPPHDDDRAAVVALARELRHATRASWLSDPFLRRVIVLEVAMFALGAYGLGGLLELIAASRVVYVHNPPFWLAAAGTGAALVVASLVVLVLLFRGSARAHRVLVDSAFTLLLAVPAASFALADDVNRGLDRARPTETVVSVTNTETRVHRSRKGGTRRSYHIITSDPAVGTDLSVDSGLYASCHAGGEIVLDIKPGALGARWFSAMRCR